MKSSKILLITLIDIISIEKKIKSAVEKQW